MSREGILLRIRQRECIIRKPIEDSHKICRILSIMVGIECHLSKIGWECIHIHLLCLPLRPVNRELVDNLIISHIIPIRYHMVITGITLTWWKPIWWKTAKAPINPLRTWITAYPPKATRNLPYTPPTLHTTKTAIPHPICHHIC